jgi:hypothetical protein
MQMVNLPQLKFYEEKLKLKWPVVYFTDLKRENVAISSDPDLQTHMIFLPPKVLLNFDFYLCDILTELCRAKLGEEIDTIFCGPVFKKEYGKLEGKEREKFMEFAKMLFFAQSHVDIWAHDIRHSVFPYFTLIDFKTFLESISKLIEKNDIKMLTSIVVKISLAQEIVELKRYHFTELYPLLLSVIKKMPQGTLNHIYRISRFYQELPNISFNKEKDIETLEKTVKEAARILEFPVSFSLIKENDRYVWEIIKP